MMQQHQQGGFGPIECYNSVLNNHENGQATQQVYNFSHTMVERGTYLE